MKFLKTLKKSELIKHMIHYYQNYSKNQFFEMTILNFFKLKNTILIFKNKINILK